MEKLRLGWCVLALPVLLLSGEAATREVKNYSPVTDQRLANPEPCNWLIDGTYCATNMGQRSPDTSRSPTRFTPIETIGDDIPTGQDQPGREQPGTLGGITFRGGGKGCIGLLRRGNCT